MKTLLQEGCFYDIIIDVKPDGVLDVVVTTDGEQHYKNISPYNETTGIYETANCYIISEDDLVDPDTGKP